MISRFFIDRPIFAAVLSIVTVIAGLVSLFVLPVAQYPEITPPAVQVSCSYPGANATVVADTVAAPIEQQVNGVENMLYMSSICTNDGTYNLTVTFKLGVNLDMAQVLVQNRVAMAMPTLPDVVKQLLGRGLNPDDRDTFGETPLHRTFVPDVIRFLLQGGAKIDALDAAGVTPLHRAAMFNRAAAVEALLAGGADKTAKTKEGKTPADLATDPKVLELLGPGKGK